MQIGTQGLCEKFTCDEMMHYFWFKYCYKKTLNFLQGFEAWGFLQETRFCYLTNFSEADLSLGNYLFLKFQPYLF